MANVIYTIILFVFVFGSVAAYINDPLGDGRGLYELRLAESGAQTDLDQVQQLNTALTDTSKSTSMSAIDQIGIIGKSIIGGLIAIFTLGPLLVSFGVPSNMMVFMISPLGIVAAFWVIEFWTGRSQE